MSAGSCACKFHGLDSIEISPECSYHLAASQRPYDHSIPWNCPTYWDGCNCELMFAQLDPQVKIKMRALADDFRIERDLRRDYNEFVDELIEYEALVDLLIGLEDVPEIIKNHPLVQMRKK